MMTEQIHIDKEIIPLCVFTCMTCKKRTTCYSLPTNLFTSCRQVALALLVPSCCNKFGTGCQQLGTSLMVLLQGCYKFLTVCSKRVDNLGQAVRTQCCMADLLQDVRFLRVYVVRSTTIERNREYQIACCTLV